MTREEKHYMAYLDNKHEREVRDKKKILNPGDRVKAKHTILYSYSEKTGVVTEKCEKGVWVEFDDGNVALCDPYYIDKENV